MRIIALIGSLAMLILPFAYVRTSLFDDLIVTTTFIGFLFYNWRIDDNSDTDTISSSWFEDGGRFHSYFEPLFILGMLVFILLIVNIVISSIASDRQYEKIPGFILIGCGILLLIIRFVALGEDDLSFYEETEVPILGQSTYLEIPLGFIWGLIFGILDLRKN